LLNRACVKASVAATVSSAIDNYCFPPYTVLMAFTRKELNQRKAAKDKLALGMAYSTANYRLLKLLLFKLLKDSNLDICYRCSQPLTVNDFSIEHTTDWRDASNPKELFFDISKIAFSHWKCNNNAAKKGGWNKGKITHGTSGYRSGCRCDECLAQYKQARRDKYVRLKT
jgi:hypothetical protein